MADVGSDGFIAQRWADAINILSLSITTLGAWWSWRAMRQAKTAAKAAQEAANATTQRNQAEFRNYIVSVAREDFKELEVCLGQPNWPSAAKRADELADSLIQLSTVHVYGRAPLRGAAEELRQWSNTFKQIELNEARFSPRKWAKSRAKVRSSLDQYFGPFAEQTGDTSDDPRGKTETDRGTTSRENAEGSG